LSINTLNTEHSDWIRCIIVISNDRLISGSNDSTIKVWNMNDNSLITSLTGHKDQMRCLVSLEHDNRLVSIADDNTYKIWDMNTYNCIKTIKLD
jgi:WD40 repeat protein